MKNNISPREWESLSAYLDGQLNTRERAQLEARLSESLDLRSALGDLRRTRTLLRSQPKLHAPRNFTLTPQMVGMRPAGRAYPTLRLFSALASLLFVIVLIGDFFAGAPRVATLQEPPLSAQAQEAMRNAPPGMGVEAGAEVNPKTLGEVQATEEAGAPMIEMAAPEPTAMAGEGPAAAAVPTDQSVQEPSSEVAAVPEAADNSAQTFDAREQAESNPGWLNRPTLRVLEIGLLLLAAATGLTAFAVRRKSS